MIRDKWVQCQRLPELGTAACHMPDLRGSEPRA